MSITRKFLGLERPALTSAAEYLLERFGRGRELDLGDTIAVMPGGRAGRRLLEILVELSQQRRLILTPPVIETVGRLPEHFYDPKRPLAGDLTQRLAWMKTAQSARAEELASVFPFHPPPGDTARWMELGDLVRRQHVELAADGLNFEDVAVRVQRVAGFTEQRRWQALHTLQQAYLWRLDQLELWDVQTARLVAIERRECATERQIVLIGTADINVALRRMLEQVADRVTALVFAPESWSDRFDALGCLLADRWQEIEISVAIGQVRLADDPADQADAVVRCIAAYEGAFSTDQITVGIADESVVPQIERRMEECGLPARWGPGGPLSDSAPLRLLAAIGEFVRRNRFDRFAALVRHPDIDQWLAASGGKDDVLPQLDDYYNDHLPNQLSDQWLGAASDSWRLRQAFRQISKLTRPLLRAKRPLASWVEPLMDVLRQVYQRRTLNRNDWSDANTLAACEKIRDALLRFADVPESLAPDAAAVDVIDWALNEIRSESVPPLRDAAAIELLGWLELALDDAPALVVCGMNEGIVPESVNADMFLPDALRRELGLLDNRRRYARDAYALSVLLQSRERVDLIVGRRNADNDPLVPSRLLFATHGEEVARRTLAFFKPTTSAVARPPLVGGLATTRTASAFAVPLPRPLTQPITSLSVTGFRSYLACPYRFYLSHVLRLESADDSAEEMDGRAFGTYLHEVLQRFADSPCRDSTDHDEIEQVLLDELASCRAEAFGAHPRAAVGVQFEQMRVRLSAFARQQAAWAGAGWRIEHSEVPAPDHADVHFMVDGQPLVLRGRIDRIDVHRETGERVILDYKSSDVAKKPEQTHVRRGEWIDLQLPLYRHFTSVLDIAGSTKLGYVNLPRNVDDTGFCVACWTEEELAAADEIARDVIRQIRNEQFWPPTDPPPDFSEEYAAICQDTVFDKA